MARTGRPRKPTRLHVIGGNPGKRKLPQNEPRPDVVVPKPPTWLRGPALTEWKFIVPRLAKLGILAEVDRMVLACYCIACGRLAMAQKKLSRPSQLVQDTTGGRAPDVWLRIADKATEQIRQFCAEFGLSPSARTHVDVKAAARPTSRALALRRRGT